MAFVSGVPLPVRAARRSVVCSVQMNSEQQKATPKVSRRAALAAAASAVTAVVASAALPRAANANIEYANVGYLGGGDQIDVNNANIRAYLKYPGMYPTLAGIIVSNGPYKSTAEIAQLPGITDAMKETLKKYSKNLVALEPAPEYELDKLNNGLYR